MDTLFLLTTAQVRLTSLQEADYPAYHDLYADPQVSIPTGLQPIVAEDASRAWFDEALRFDADKGKIIALRTLTSDKLVGVVRLTDWDHQNSVINLGYCLAKSHWGQGLMAAVLDKLLPWLMAGGLGKTVHRVQAWVLPNNRRSQSLLHKLRFVHEGTFRGLFFDSEKHVDVLIYGLLPADLATLQASN